MTMTQVILPDGWPRPKGYANGVVASGRMLFIAGMIGWDAQGVFHSDDFAVQARQALQEYRGRAARSGRQAGKYRPHDLVRDRQARVPGCGREVGRAFREIIGSYNAAMTAVEVKALIEDRAKVEIEATAVLPDQPST